jgi:hypothetical protein
MLWHVSHDDVWAEQQGCLQPEGCLVMQEIFPPVVDHKFRQNHGQRVGSVRSMTIWLSLQSLLFQIQFPLDQAERLVINAALVT